MARVIDLSELLKERLGEMPPNQRTLLEEQAVNLVSKVPNLDRMGALEILYSVGRLAKEID
jgi:hypothetical protein